VPAVGTLGFVPPPATVTVRFEDWPLIWLWPMGLVFMQVTFLRIAGFDVTLGVVACHLLQLLLLLRYWLGRPSTWPTIAGLTIPAYALLIGTTAEDHGEFLRSMAYLANLVVMVLLCLNLRIRDPGPIRRSVWVLCWLAMATALVVFWQAFAFNVLHDLRWANLLGDFAPPRGPLTDQIYAPHPMAPVKRANGWYSEPSVAAWFLIFVAAVALAVRPLRPRLASLTALVCLAGAVATLSLTGILGALLVLLVHLVFVRDRLGFKLIWWVLGGGGAPLGLWIAYQLGILARYAEIGDPGASIYFRFTAPLLLVSDSLPEYPLGYPIGQTDLIATKSYFINWEGGAQHDIQNTLLLVVFHFGLLGILLNAAYLVQAARHLVLLGSPRGLLMLAVAIAVLAGPGWTHHTALLVGYAILVGRHLCPAGASRLAPRRTPRLTLVSQEPVHAARLWPGDASSREPGHGSAPEPGRSPRRTTPERLRGSRGRITLPPHREAASRKATPPPKAVSRAPARPRQAPPRAPSPPRGGAP